MNKNKKGMGLVMVIILVAMMLIMAGGIITFSFNTKSSVDNQTEKLRLYWAAESGSNYSISWWTNQNPETRIFWPYYYDPSEDESFTYNDFLKSENMLAQTIEGNANKGYQFLGGTGGGQGGGQGGGNSGDDDVPDPGEWDYDLTAGTDAEGTTTNNNWQLTVPSEYWDIKGQTASIDGKYRLGSLPEECWDIADNNDLYVHPSSEVIVLTYPGSEDTYTLYLLRYKGERIDKAGAAVWVFDTWAVDNNTNNAHRVLMSNVFNFNPTSTEWLQFNEAMVHTQWATQNGRKGVFNDSHYFFGQSYFAENVRFDYKTNHSTGPTFYGRIKSSSPDISGYGQSVGTAGTPVTQGIGIAWEKGLFAEGKFSNLSDAVNTINGSVLGGWEAIPPMDSENIVWSWDEVESVASLDAVNPSGIYMLSEAMFKEGQDIKIVLRTEGSGEDLATYADITDGNETQTVRISSKAVQGIAIPTEYGDVRIEGNASDNFSLFTEEDIVKITDHLYLTEMEECINIIEDSPDISTPSFESMAKLYEVMFNTFPDSHISIIAGLGLIGMDGEDYTGIPAQGDRENMIDLSEMRNGQFVFTNASYFLGYGELGVPGGQPNAGLAFYNIGSFIIDGQSSKTGSNSFKGTTAYIQDKRFYQEDFGGGVGWGSGPGDESEPVSGLNAGYRWIGNYHGDLGDLESQFYDITKR